MMVSIAYQKLVFFIVADNSFLMKMVIVRTQKIISIFIIKFIYFKIIFNTVISFYLHLCNRFLLPRKRRKIEK